MRRTPGRLDESSVIGRRRRGVHAQLPIALAGLMMALVGTTVSAGQRTPSPPSAKPSKVETAPLKPSEIAGRALPATVAIVGETADGSQVSGSGFLVDASGTVVTNLHVMAGLTKARVVLQNGDAYDRVTIRAYDERKDLAILQVPAFNLPVLPLGDSDNVKPGDSVLLIGNPLGLSGSLSAGIVSAIRPMQGYRVFQTDAAANPGNSGGPMLDSTGEVVGVLTFGLKTAENLNFVVPVNYVRGLLSVNEGLDLAALARRLPKEEPNAEPAKTASMTATVPEPEPSAVGSTPSVASPHVLGPSQGGMEASHALVYVYRSSGWAGRVWDPPVFLDDVELVAMDNKRYFSVWVTPGLHAFKAGGGSTQSCEQPVGGDFQAGLVYYLKLDLYFMSCFALTPKNPQVAAQEVRKLRPLDGKNVRHSAVLLR